MKKFKVYPTVIAVVVMMTVFESCKKEASETPLKTTTAHQRAMAAQDSTDSGGQDNPTHPHN